FRNSLPGHINWYKSKALWCYVEKRLDALVALAKNMNSQKNCRYTARQLTGVALIAFMLSSLVHRPSDRSWWKPFSDQLKSHRCRKSMALFVPGLFQLSEDGSQWSCAITMKQYLHDIFHEGIIQEILHDHDYVAELSEWHYKLPILLEKNIAVNNLNLDLGLYDQYIDLVNKVNYHWDHAVLYVGCYGLTDALVEPFVNLLMHEVLSKFSKWDKYCKNKESYQKLMAYGSNFFRDKEYLKDILKVSS
ncbi:hypothetical protein RO3G_17268, partial [Rhizopus delemar RA 99-880]